MQIDFDFDFYSQTFIYFWKINILSDFYEKNNNLRIFIFILFLFPRVPLRSNS